MDASTAQVASSRRRARRAAVALATLALAAATSACGRSEPAIEAAGLVASTSSTATPSTTRASTTAPSTTAPSTTAQPPSTTTTSTTTSTTTTSTTTTSTTTLPAQVTEPIAPPLDVHADEPVIELGTISIPKIGVEATMFEGIRQTTLDRGPGHWPGSAMPGQVGNVVVAGHRVSKHRVFRNIDQLTPGDEIVFHDATGEHRYSVDHTEIVDPSAIWIIEPSETPIVTLFACHPPGSTRERIVVVAHLVTG